MSELRSRDEVSVLDNTRPVTVHDVLLWMRWQECFTCGGEGWEPVPDEDRSDRSTTPCSDCVGGLVPPASQVEAVAWGIVMVDLAPHFVQIAKREIAEKARRQARDGLLAMARTLDQE